MNNHMIANLGRVMFVKNFVDLVCFSLLTEGARWVGIITTEDIKGAQKYKRLICSQFKSTDCQGMCWLVNKISSSLLWALHQ